MKEFFLVRHVQSEHNVGQVEENMSSKLTDKGIREAKQMGKYFKRFDIDCIITSEATRTKETARLIAESSDFKGKTAHTPLLNETYHDMKIKEQTEFREGFNRLIREYERKYDGDPVGFFDNMEIVEKEVDKLAKHYHSESIEHIEKRLNEFLDYLEKMKCNKIIIITHSRVINILHNIILGHPHLFYNIPTGRGYKPKGPGSLSRWRITGNDEYELLTPMSTSHITS